MEKLINFNQSQQRQLLLQVPFKVQIEGRGTGKSRGAGWTINLNNKYMPRSVSSITGQTYSQLLTRTLPSTFAFLESLGYIRDIHYVINKKPPAHFKTPYENLMKYDNVITMINGTCYLLASQDRPGSGRGPNLDFELVDEALTLIKDRYDSEISPANRGNLDKWGPNGTHPVSWHHGFHYLSSMPPTRDGAWLLKFGEYYEKEAGIDYFAIWNRVVQMQLELLDTDDPKVFKDIWNEIVILKQRISPFPSKDGVLFTLSNAFDNIENVGLSYMKREFKKQVLTIFLIEIMNMVLDKIDNPYYQINEKLQVYKGPVDESMVIDLAKDSDYDFHKLSNLDSRFDLDCEDSKELELSFDWGATVSVMTVGQERSFDFVSALVVPYTTDNLINEFYAKPDGKKVMIDEIIDDFCDYYRYHQRKVVKYYRDRYGDHRQANKSMSYNEQAIARLQHHGWVVESLVHKGQEPPQHDKYLLWAYILKETNPKFPKFRINKTKCKYTLISMNNTRVIDKDGKFTKDKKSEKSKKILPEEATHFGDAVDKKIWTKYNHMLKRGSTFVDVKI